MRRLGREQRGFPSVDRVLSELDSFSKQYGQGIDLTRPKTVATAKLVEFIDPPLNASSGNYVDATIPTFEGSLTSAEHMALSNAHLSRSVPILRIPRQDINTVLSVPNVTNINKAWYGIPSNQDSDVPDRVRNIPGFGESLSRVRDHLRSPQLQNALETIHRNMPAERPGGRFVQVEDVRDTDYIDLQTQNWAEMDPEGWFPDRSY